MIYNIAIYTDERLRPLFKMLTSRNRKSWIYELKMGLNMTFETLRIDAKKQLISHIT